MNFFFNVNFWGERYTRFFLDYGLPSQLADGNIPFMLRHATGTIKYRIYTTREDAVTVLNSPVYARLCELMATDIVYLEDFDLYNRHSRGTMTQCHADAISYANTNDFTLLFVWPDIVFSNNALGTLFNLAMSGKTTVFVGSLAVHTGRFLDDLRRNFSITDSVLDILPRNLVKMGVHNLSLQSELWMLDSEYFYAKAPWLFWKVPGEGLLQRAFHLTPMLLTPDDKTLKLEYDSYYELGLDGNNYLGRALRDIFSVHIIEDSDDFFLVAFNDEKLPVARNTFSPLDVAREQHEIFQPYHYKLFSHKLRFHYTDLSPQWQMVEAESDAVSQSLHDAFENILLANKIGACRSFDTDTGKYNERADFENNSNRINSRKKSILFICLEFLRWDQARSWSYQAGIGLEEGFSANDIDFLTVPAFHELSSGDPGSWLAYLRDICRGRKFDQVWIELVHNNLDDAILSYIASLAPVRLAIISESIDYTDDVCEKFPQFKHRRTQVMHRLRYMTHALMADEIDAQGLNENGSVKALWWVQAIPERLICPVPVNPNNGPAFFSGTLYGDREGWLYHPLLQDLLVHQKPLEEETPLPGMFDHANVELVRTLLTMRSFSDRVRKQHLELLRAIRSRCFELWLKGLNNGSAVVNLPTFYQGYAGRVYEGIAAGRPVITWHIPGRPRTGALFENGSEILSFPGDNPVQLAEHLLRIKKEPAYAATIAANATAKLKRFHTIEIRVKQILEWIESGKKPVYFG